MPRKARIVLPGQPQHIIIRGVNREPVFYQTDDYYYYLDRLSYAIEKHGCIIHAYVLMTNHVHLLITPSFEHSISKAIQTLGRYYVQYFNQRNRRTGTLWEGRYKAAMVDSEQYLLTCYRYIELNPVRAKMVEHPSDYPWSSYRCNAAGQTNSIVTPHQEYQNLATTTEARQRCYRTLFDAQIPKKRIDEIRKTTNQEWVLGSDYFKSKIETQLQRQVKPGSRGGDRRSKEFKDRQDFKRH
ncbi:MAG: putative transposase [Gammaproteobacteria bacterium]|jgi:putative transposase